MTKTFRILPALIFMLFSLVLSDLYRTQGNVYNHSFSVPTMEPAGVDFRAMYTAAASIRENLTGYKKIYGNVFMPIVSVLYVPLTFLTVDTAYVVFSFILILALYSAIYLTLSLSLTISWPVSLRMLVTSLITAILYHTHSIQFALERGNYDIIAMLAIILALYFSISRPLLSGLFVGLATTLKIYPIYMLMALCRRISIGSIAVVLTSIILGVLCLGRVGLSNFSRGINSMLSYPPVHPINHSLSSFLTIQGWSQTSVWYFLLLMVVPLIALTLMLFLRDRAIPFWKLTPKQGPLTLSEVSLFGACISLMGLAVSTSYDYKLFIQFFPFLLGLGVMSESTKLENVYTPLFCLIAFCVSMCFSLDRSAQSTVWIIALYILYLAILIIEQIKVFRYQASSSFETSSKNE